jgi:hypothetical protein
MCNGDGVDYVLLESTEVTNYHHVDRKRTFVLGCTRRLLLYVACGWKHQSPETIYLFASISISTCCAKSGLCQINHPNFLFEIDVM